MKKIFILMVCLVAIAFAAEMIPAHIPASAIEKAKIQTEPIYIEAECIYTGVTTYPPWLDYGRDAPWSTDVRIDDVYDVDDVLTSMAEDALGRIYVCYETAWSPSPIRYGWGLATSIDNGQTWDNRVYRIADTDYDLRYPEIAITDDGKIWVWGSFSQFSQAVTNAPSFMRSNIGGYNDPDNLYGVTYFGSLPNFTYPEVVTWGNGNQFVIAQYLDDEAGTASDQIFCLFSHDSTAYYGLNFTPSGGYPEKTSISVDVVGNDTILIHGIEYYDAAGSDWDVVCYLDTLNGSGGLYGWGTGNPADDRYPSVFASQGYAYIAYQADVGGGDNDIMFNYSTDYGENWASIVDLTNDATMETYPRLYGIDQTIGIDYVYGLNRVRFNYSLDNGISWLGTPEQINEGTTVNSGYHAASLLYTSSYWHAAWEDTRNSGTDGLEIYTSRRNLGQGDITHRPAILTFNYDWSFSGSFCADKHIIRHIDEPIDPKLADEMRMSGEHELIPVFIMLAKQMNPDYLIPRAEQMSKPDRRQFVITECQQLADEDQKALLAYLRQKENEGKVLDIVSQWTTNTICLKAKPEVIKQIAQRNDIWGIGYSEPLQLIGVENTEKPIYKHVDFIPEDGREICWGVAKINADDVWSDYTGAGVIVGHMDSGVNYNHDDLDDHMWDGSPTYPHHGWDFSSGDDDPMDENGHGTLTAGIVAGDGTCGSNTGVAPDAQIMALRIYPGTSAEMGQAISFALTHNADLLSCSIGWEDPSNSIKNWCRGQSITIYAAGIVWCNAAGNGRSVPPYGHYVVPQDINSPADCPAPWYSPNDANRTAVMAVGATDQGDDVCSWSSYGPTHWDTGTYTDYPHPPGLIKPDVAAPGTGLKSLRYDDDTGYDNTNVDGTSFSQPHLAGTIALMLERAPGLTPRQIDSIIENHAVIDINPVGRDNLSGAGRIDALMAVNAISPGYRAKTVWVINRATATGILQVTDITQDESQPWIVGISPTQFTVPIDDSVAVWVSTDTTGLSYPQGSMHYDTLLIASNTVFDDNPERVPVILIMATFSIEEDEDLTPGANANLLSILPNPFRTSVQIDYILPTAQDVNFTIYDVCGQKVKTFIDEYQDAGQFSVTWTGCDDKGRKLAAGIYFGRIEVGKNAVTNKLILIR